MNWHLRARGYDWNGGGKMGVGKWRWDGVIYLPANITFYVAC